jgi:nucleoside triphosphate diphosphatase
VSERKIDELIALMATLRDPEKGCPWDREQTFASVAPYTIEESYEVADAIERNDLNDLRDELGDLLFQVVFHARMAEEQSAFNFDDVVDAVVEKMTRRHPHVFADEKVADAEEQTHAWEKHKAAERKQSEQHSLLDGVALGLPALSRAYKLQKRAARAGFDWPAIDGVLHKVEEELNEIRAEIVKGDNEALQQEIGDLLFACVNLARHTGGDAEELLRAANGKFERRFRHLESALQKQGKELQACSLVEMDALWESAKQEGL